MFCEVYDTDSLVYEANRISLISKKLKSTE